MASVVISIITNIPMELKTIVEKSDKLSLPVFQHSLKVPSSISYSSSTRPHSVLDPPSKNNSLIPIIYPLIVIGSIKQKFLSLDSHQSWEFLIYFFPKNKLCQHPRSTKKSLNKFRLNFFFFSVHLPITQGIPFSIKDWT